MTIVLRSVARLDGIFLTPIFANIAVIPAKKAEPTANIFQLNITPSCPTVGTAPSAFRFAATPQSGC